MPAVIGADEAELLLDTGAQGGVVLDYAYAASRALVISDVHLKPSAFAPDQGRKAGTTRVDRLGALGRMLTQPTLSVSELFSISDPLRGQAAGYLGPRFLNDAALVIDPQSRTVGISKPGDHRPLLESAVLSLKLLPTSREPLPFTTDVRDALFAGAEPLVALLDTGSPGSILSIDYVRRKKGHRVLRWFLERAYRRGASVSWTFELPPTLSFRTRVRLLQFSEAYVIGTGMDRVDAILGMDFLGGWVSVFSFSAGMVGLFHRTSSS